MKKCQIAAEERAFRCSKLWEKQVSAPQHNSVLMDSFTQPWSETTFNCLNEKSAKRNKHAAMIYYRGGVVNQEDLYEALKKGEIWVRYK